MAVRDVEQEFADRGIERHGIKLLRPADARAFLARCRQHGIEVLGIDGFRVDGDSIQPLVEHSIDLTLRSSRGAPIEEATDFLASRLGTDFWFEVVVER
ncbi:MAG TPA: hypothetical protein VFI31_15235 [Pirellulales bacterium]|nr:hypothetical protein [Pirellulales bacterium]